MVGESRAHGLVAHPVSRQHGAVVNELLPDGLQALRRMRLEIGGGVRDAARDTHGIDLPWREPALLLQLAHEVILVDGLHLAHEGGAIEPVDVEHL